ncbi:MAG: class I adenylate-forming enzyme family protein, partial [Actinomycetota bacterium]
KGSLLDDDGWFPTRDGGYIDTDGYLFIQGRNDDVIIRGGENMSPGEIEDVAISHPNVRNAAAIGVPCREWGEKVVLVIVPDGDDPDPVELDTLIRERLRSSRVPAHVESVEELPHNETGKLLRRVLRERFAHLGDDPAS